jgi:hypothetical protein
MEDRKIAHSPGRRIRGIATPSVGIVVKSVLVVAWSLFVFCVAKEWAANERE